MENTKKLESKLKITYDALIKLERWYTGLPLKKYLKSQVFELDKKHKNPAITASRWSAYCHYNQVKSLDNLLEKQGLSAGANVLVHPLLPRELVKLLLDKKLNILSLDIDKSHLSFDQGMFNNFLIANQKSNQKIDLIINYGFNGLYEYQTEQVEFANKYIIPTILVIDNPNVNFALLKLYSVLKLGGVLWNFGDSFLDEHLDEVLDYNLESSNWCVSWHIETRMRSILEYHLSDSQKEFESLFEAYIFLLSKKFASLKLVGKAYHFGVKNILLKNKIKNSDEAHKIIQNQYFKIHSLAIPDLVFDLQMHAPVKFPKTNLELIHKSSDLQSKTKDFYSHFLNLLPSKKTGSIEIPDLYLEKTYLNYFVYTTEFEQWYKDMYAQGVLIKKLKPIHEIFINQNSLSRANFVANYILTSDLASLV